MTTQTVTKTIQLQSIGKVAAIPASELKVGDLRMYNFGSTGLIVAIKEKTTLTLEIITFESDKYYVSDIRKTRLIAIAKRDQDVSGHRPTEANSRKGIKDVTDFFPEVATAATEVVAIQETPATPETETQTTLVTIPVQSITFKWSESSIINDNTTVSTFADANNLIHSVAYDMTHNNELGYRKTAFVITWEDGRKHEGRIDISSTHINKHNPIGEHVKYFLEGLAGLKKPSEWTQSQYMNHLKSIYKIDTQEMEEIKQVLETYLLDDIKGETPKEPEALPALETMETVTVITDTESKAIEATTDVPEVNEAITTPVVTGYSQNVTVTYNNALNGIELTFENELSPEEISKIKSNGFRWSHRKQLFYAKQSEKTIAYANSLSNDSITKDIQSTVTPSTINPEPITYPSIDIDDLHLYTVSDELQRGLHSISMFEVDHKQDCINAFENIQTIALELINSTDSEEIQYRVKKYLQSYKKRYYEQYIKMLNHRSNSPSWTITGRGGLNVSQYSKKQNRYDNMIKQSIDLTSEFNKNISKFKSIIHKYNQDAFKQSVMTVTDSITETIPFITETKSISFMGHTTEQMRTYNAAGYTVAKLWGKFRILDSNGKEVKTTLKTTSKLDEAKMYVMYLIHQNKEKQDQAV